MPYANPFVLPAGNILSAGFINDLVANNLYFMGIISAEQDCFMGGGGSSNEQSGYGERVGWTGYFCYGGRNTLYNSIGGSNIRLYITDNVGRKKIYDNASGPSSTLDFTNDTSSAALSLTLGNYYKFEACWVVPGSSGASSGAVNVNYAAVEQPQATNWPTLVAFNDNDVPANFQPVLDAQEFIRAVAEVPHNGGIEIAMADDAVSVTIYGSFVYTGQTSFNITIWSPGTAGGFPTVGAYTLAIVANSTTESHVFGGFSVSDPDTRTDTYVLGTDGGTYTVNTRYNFTISMSSSGNPLWVRRVWMSGALALTTTPFALAPFDEVRGSTGTPRLKPMAGSATTDNLKELITFLNGAPSIGSKQYGRHELAAATGAALGGLTYDSLFSINHRFPIIRYRPTGAGQSGTLTFGTQTVSLPDNIGDGSWTSFLLDSQPLLGYGYVYQVTNVLCCFETAS